MNASDLQRAIDQAVSQYHRLVLLVGSSGTGKTAVLQAVAKERNCNLLNVNLELSKALLELPRTQRPRKVDRLFQGMIENHGGDLVLLDNLEVLFDPALALEPLQLLKKSSRNRTIVASWNGEYRDDALSYAEPGHPEHQRFKPVEALVLTAEEK